jgi:pimeloyl-ACP methyl ester carboxylesterase
MDALHIDRVNLAGHSIAGAEMTRFAVTKNTSLELVYLDAPFDYALSSGSRMDVVLLHGANHATFLSDSKYAPDVHSGED